MDATRFDYELSKRRADFEARRSIIQSEFQIEAKECGEDGSQPGHESASAIAMNSVGGSTLAM